MGLYRFSEICPWGFAWDKVRDVLSRVGDRPIATTLHAQFHFFDFCARFLWQNIRPTYGPPRRGKYKVNWRGSFAAPAF